MFDENDDESSIQISTFIFNKFFLIQQIQREKYHQSTGYKTFDNICIFCVNLCFVTCKLLLAIRRGIKHIPFQFVSMTTINK